MVDIRLILPEAGDHGLLAGDMTTQYRPPESCVPMGLRSVRAIRAVFLGMIGEDFRVWLPRSFHPW
jgi:hypothetical protein